MSFNDCPTYKLAKYLSKILTPTTNIATQKLKKKNSYQLKEELKDMQIPDDYDMVSFNVKALFTSIPIDLEILVVEESITEDPLLTTKTSLNIEDIMKLTKFCLETAYF